MSIIFCYCVACRLEFPSRFAKRKLNYFFLFKIRENVKVFGCDEWRIEIFSKYETNSRFSLTSYAFYKLNFLWSRWNWDAITFLCNMCGSWNHPIGCSKNEHWIYIVVFSGSFKKHLVHSNQKRKRKLDRGGKLRRYSWTEHSSYNLSRVWKGGSGSRITGYFFGNSRIT